MICGGDHGGNTSSEKKNIKDISLHRFGKNDDWRFLEKNGIWSHNLWTTL